jgi:hypothetical protein
MKLGFLVEGDTDRLVVEAIARRILPRGISFHTVRVGGKAALMSAYTSAIVLLSKGYDHVILIFDADTQDPESVVKQQVAIETTLVDHHLQEKVTVVAAIPTVTAWLGISLDKLSTSDAARLASSLSISSAEANNPSIAHFGKLLRELAGLHAGSSS